MRAVGGHNPSAQPEAESAVFTCGPHHLIENYNAAARWSSTEAPLYAYLLWGAEYWILRAGLGDRQHLGAFERLLQEA